MTSAAPAREGGDERSRRLWLVVRRALLMICKEIERVYGTEYDVSTRDSVVK